MSYQSSWERTIAKLLNAYDFKILSTDHLDLGADSELLHEYCCKIQFELWEFAKLNGMAAAEYIVAHCWCDIVWEEVAEFKAIH